MSNDLWILFCVFRLHQNTNTITDDDQQVEDNVNNKQKIFFF